ncbi:MAG TPA: hypothetical protein VG709_02745, partial [Actinomycetota bacterium]|nr:hypothetical protein [Actinomycetota bacterium]
ALPRARRPASQGSVERLDGYLETNFEPGRRFAPELDFALQLDNWRMSGSSLNFGGDHSRLTSHGNGLGDLLTIEVGGGDE